MLDALFKLLTQDGKKFFDLFLGLLCFGFYATGWPAGFVLSGCGFLMLCFFDDIKDDWNKMIFHRELSSLGA